MARLSMAECGLGDVHAHASSCMEMFKAGCKGYGVRAATRIPAGTGVCEYVGEVLSECWLALVCVCVCVCVCVDKRTHSFS
jgi:hypothetical protein